MKPWVAWLLLSLILILSFVIRVYPRWDMTLQDGMVVFTETDTWYHMRLADVMDKNFPAPLIVDQFAALGGAKVGFYPLMTWVIVGPSKMLGLDYNVVGAFIPPIIACLGLLLIFLIGWELTGKVKVGLGASLVASILPTQFLQRSLLGNPDHHILEALLLFLSLYFLLKFLKEYRVLWSLLLGLSLSLYLSCWWGSLMVFVPLLVSIFIEFLKVHIQGKASWKLLFGLLLVGALTFSLPMVIRESLTDTRLYVYTLTGYIGFLSLLGGASLLRPPKSYFLLALGFCGALVFLYLSGFYVQLLNLSSYAFGNFRTSIGEAVPMSIYTYFDVFNLSAIFLLVGLYLFCKNKESLTFLVFSMFFLILNIFQVRWSYYSILPASILTAYFLYWVSNHFLERFKTPIYITAILMLIIPSFGSMNRMVTSPPLISNDWGRALIWLNISTPKPYEDPGAYTSITLKEEPKYTVLSWWDYGHFIIRISQRVPLTTPTNQVFRDAPDFRFLTETNTEKAKMYLKGFRVKYILIDNLMLTGKFPALIERYRPTSLEEIGELRTKCMAYKLYTQPVKGYRCVFANQTVKIFEVEDFDDDPNT